MKFIDWFAGVGGFRRGLELAGHECVGFCEADRYAVMSYTSMHLITEEQRKKLLSLPFKERQEEILKEDYRNGEWYSNDVRDVLGGGESIPRADIWCFGFPCQDISIAGKQLGFQGHRSSLFFTVTDLIDHISESDRPKWLLIENVKNLLNINGGFDFAKLLIELDGIGYDAEWSILNSKDFGVPQNRERVYIIGHLRADCRQEVLPSEEPVGQSAVYSESEDPCRTALAKESMIAHREGFRRNTQVYAAQGVTEALDTGGGGGRHPFVAVDRKSVKIKSATASGYEEAMEGDSINIQRPTSETRRGRVGKQIAQTLDTGCEQYVIDTVINPNTGEEIAIRKLTPRECWRLQGWSDEYFDRAEMVNSDSQLYKQAGNGVTVPVVEWIARRLK